MDRKWWTLITVCIATFMLLLDITIVNVALPRIQSGLHSSFTDLQWVIDAYALTLGALLLTAGSLADLLGRRMIFAIGVVLFSAASLLCGLAQSPVMLDVSRGIQGVGGAMMFATSLALLGQAYRGRDRGVAFGAWGAVTGAAVAIGPIVGGALTQGISWRWIFLVNVPIGAVALLLTLSKLEESAGAAGRTAGHPGLRRLHRIARDARLRADRVEPRRLGQRRRRRLPDRERRPDRPVRADRAPHPPADARPVAVPPTGVHGRGAGRVAVSASIFSMFLYLTLYLQDVLGLSPLAAGLRFIVLSGVILVVAAIAGRLTTVVPVRLLMGAGLILAGVSLILMGGITVHSSWTHLLPGFVVGGLGVGLINPPLASTAIAVVPPRQAGMGSGINSTFRQLGIATGIAALGSIFTSEIRTHVAAGLRAAHQSRRQRAERGDQQRRHGAGDRKAAAVRARSGG